MSYNSHKEICKSLYSIFNVDAMTEGSFLIGDDNTKYTMMEDVGTTTEDFLCKLVAGTHVFVEKYLMVSNYQKLRLKG